ncbi:MAG: hypothetical protein RLN79_08445 [Cytophagales bacterium]
MAKLKVSASTLPELIIATLIICICFVGFSQSMLHFFAPEYLSKSESIQSFLEKLESEILNDDNFPQSLNSYRSTEIEIQLSDLFNSDSLLLVTLIYSDKQGTHSIVKNFIYVKD